MSIQIQQQTDEWLELRKKYIGSSDASVIMGISPWKTPYQLWQEKLSLIPPCKKTPAMERGLLLEEKARMIFEEVSGEIVFPDIVLHENKFMMASLDGLSLNKKVQVEIKCPQSHQNHFVDSGKMPDIYYPQVQHQLECTGNEFSYYFSYDGNTYYLLEIKRNEAYINMLIEKEYEFYQCLKNNVTPQFTNKDYIEKSDISWKKKAIRWKELQEQEKKILQEKEELKNWFINSCGEYNAQGEGVKISKHVRKGVIDYSKISVLEHMDLEKYRKSESEVWKIDVI